MSDASHLDAIEGPDGENLVAVVRPPVVQVILWAAIAWAVLIVVGALTVLPYSNYFHDYFIKLNNKAKVKKANFTGQTVDNYVHRFMVYGVLSAILIAVVVVFLAALTVRGKNKARWTLVLLATGVPSLVCAVLPVGVVYHLFGIISGFPVLYRVGQGAGLVAALVVLALTVHPQTRAWYRQITPPRTGGGLFSRGAQARPTVRPAGRPSLLSTLLGRRTAPAAATDAQSSARPVRAPGEVDSDSDSADSDSAVARTKRKATRPGSVKPKGQSGPGTGRAKSRQR